MNEDGGGGLQVESKGGKIVSLLVPDYLLDGVLESHLYLLSAVSILGEFPLQKVLVLVVVQSHIVLIVLGTILYQSQGSLIDLCL